MLTPRKKKWGFCVKTERNRLSIKYGELGKVIIISSLAVKCVDIWAGFSDLTESKLVPYRAQSAPVFPAPLTWYTLASVSPSSMFTPMISSLEIPYD